MMLMFCTVIFIIHKCKWNIFPLWGISTFNIPATLQYFAEQNALKIPTILLNLMFFSKNEKLERTKNKQIHTKKYPV